MKRNNGQSIGAFLLLGLLSACQGEQLPEPKMMATVSKEAVQGKWLMSKISYQGCQSGQCNSINYNGAGVYYFSFTADSAFLFRSGEAAAARDEV